MTYFDTIGFIGLGLIGGSIARAIKYFYPDTYLMACSRTASTLKAAREEGVIDRLRQRLLSGPAKGCDFGFLHSDGCGKHQDRHP